MKNMIEVPSEKDFYRTKNVELTNNHNGTQKIHYRDCNIAMRSITDFTSIKNEVETLDEEKLPEYEKEMDSFKEKYENHKLNEGLLERPEMPIRTVIITGTIVTYFNGMVRIIVDDFDDFEKEYFNYLKMSRLDLGIEK